MEGSMSLYHLPLSLVLCLCFLRPSMMSPETVDNLPLPTGRKVRSAQAPNMLVYVDKPKLADAVWSVDTLQSGDDSQKMATLLTDYDDSVEDAMVALPRPLKQKLIADVATSGSRAIQPNWALTSRNSRILLPLVKRAGNYPKSGWSKWWSSMAFPLHHRKNDEMQFVEDSMQPSVIGLDDDGIMDFEQSPNDMNSAKTLRYGK